MLIIGLIAAGCFYVALYWLFLAASSNPAASSILTALNQMIWMPEAEIFVLLRGLIIITFFYVVADAIISPTRRGLKNQRQRRADAERERKAFRGIRTSQPLLDEDEDDLYETDSSVDSNLAPPRYSA